MKKSLNLREKSIKEFNRLIKRFRNNQFVAVKTTIYKDMRHYHNKFPSDLKTIIVFMTELYNFILKKNVTVHDVYKKFGMMGLVGLLKMKKYKNLIKFYNNINKLKELNMSAVIISRKYKINPNVPYLFGFKKKLPISRKEKKEIIKLRKKGWSIRQLSKTFHRHINTIIDIIGSTDDPNEKFRYKTYKKIKRLREHNFTWMEIGYILDMSSSGVYHMYHKYSIKEVNNEINQRKS